MNKYLTLALLASTLLPGCHSKDEEEPANPVATVKVQPLHRGRIEQTVTAYGSVVAEPGKSAGLSVPYECSIVRTLVVPGQQVKTGDSVVEVAASAATELQVGQAETALKTAETELKQTKQRYELKLATNQDLNQAQRAADDARLQLNSLEKNGAASRIFVKSPVDGVVLTLSAQAGQTVAAGTTLAEIAAEDAIEVRLNIEPEDLDALRVGGTLKLIPVNQPTAQAVTGTVRLLTASVNPTSRLVDVFVGFPKDSGFLLGGYIHAEFSRQAENAWIVPVPALLTNGEGTHIFVVRDGKAAAQPIEVGLRNKDRAEIRGEGLQDAESVVVEGNYELEDGMRVEVK
jgi:RND family efflux transporter MFP subunit